MSIRVEAVGKYGAEIPDQRPGEHLWIITGMWRVADPVARARYELDLENLLTLAGPGCYWCEEPWSEDLARRRCRAPIQRTKGRTNP